MRQDVLNHAGCHWIDIIGLERAEMEELAAEFELPPTVVEDCLDPDHLPKLERFGDACFLILRARDKDAQDDAGTIQELTRKVAIYLKNGLLLTVHRTDLEELKVAREKFQNAPSTDISQTAILVAVVEATLESFDAPLVRAEATLDHFEDGVFDDDIPPPSLQDAHYLKRRIALSRRLLWQTSNILQKLVPPADRAEPLYQDMRESAEAYLFWTEQLLDEVNQLLQIHLAASSHRTNEVMRVLTILSVFFLPLTFIVGIYGMNFQRMPELSSPYGYPITLMAMMLMCVGIYAWFKRKGWL